MSARFSLCRYGESTRTTEVSSSTTAPLRTARDHLHPVPSGGTRTTAHVEQRNWARVRELVGYYRYDTAAELAKLNEIWELDALFINYFLPQQKLIFKQRSGAKVIKKYDAATTPHERAVAHSDVRKRPIIAMNATFKRLKPAALSRQILALTSELEVLAQAKAAPPNDRSSGPIVDRQSAGRLNSLPTHYGARSGILPRRSSPPDRIATNRPPIASKPPTLLGHS